ncbi:hypothetical protein DFH06DRAFT_1126676 [Mycena polygramma]|nr:hypothetical protein DFH06DRAFT_1126676 [Mycena polygramma]
MDASAATKAFQARPKKCACVPAASGTRRRAYEIQVPAPGALDGGYPHTHDSSPFLRCLTHSGSQGGAGRRDLNTVLRGRVMAAGEEGHRMVINTYLGKDRRGISQWRAKSRGESGRDGNESRKKKHTGDINSKASAATKAVRFRKCAYVPAASGTRRRAHEDQVTAPGALNGG